MLLALAACKPVKPEPTPGPTPGPSGDITISGVVRGSDGKAIEGVVVSDGLNCVVTDAQGMYKLPADLSKTKFVIVSTPSGYNAPESSGVPEFFKRLSELSKTGGVYTNVDFTLYKIANPDRYTIIFTADPQPRASSAGYDKLGYHSLDICDDMYRDLKEFKSTVTDRPVYGISLGDITHENASLYSNYKKGLSTLGFPTYNVIGNHDHTYSKEDCSDDFEAAFGPCNYSFNLGGLHYIVLDNMIMTLDSDAGKYKSVNDGLTDEIWQWLQNDLSFVPTTTPLVVCAHSPMVRHNDKDRNGRHYADCRALFQRYAKVYQWAGHVHSSYNYVNKSNPTVEAHSVTRTTGELWTNEYIGSNGTPRGYVVMDVDGTSVSWKFKPIVYQKAAFVGQKIPKYEYRDWDFNENGVAVLKDGGARLTDEYQMHIYKPHTYGSSDGYIYVNVFLWDELWDLPKLTVDGAVSVMTRVTSAQAASMSPAYPYDMSNKEIVAWYKANNTTLKGDASYSANPSQCFSMFRAFVDKEHGSGTVSVKDRFGNVYKQSITW